MGFAPEDGRHLRELCFQQRAKQRADVDAGKKIARAARSLNRAGVVPVLGIVEREIHERGHGERTTITDQVREMGFGIRDSGFDRLIVNESQIPNPESRPR